MADNKKPSINLNGAEIKRLAEDALKSLEPFEVRDIVARMQETINRQQAEIERLKERDELNEKIIREQGGTILQLKDWNGRLKDINFELSEKGEKAIIALLATRAEAIKEFAERLKFEKATGMNWFGKERYTVRVEDIDNLVKEMVGDE